MNNLKRSLALVLVVCMLCSFLPVGAFAAGNTADNAAVPESNEAVIQATSNLTPVEPNRPADGPTQNQPFPSGTAGSQYFRIPAITTLSNGNLVAAADARWNDIYDKGNIDTLVSISEDNGANWNYTFANYIDDGGNTFNISAATFIDPAMAVKNVDGVETIYMVADLFPGQATGSTMCIHAALYGTGMTNDGHLRVSDLNDNNLNDFNYYVGDYTDGVAPLCNADGTATDYVVDEWFNVYKNGTHLGNLFTYGDVTDGSKTFYVYQTSYLYLTKSTDGGKTWSAPTLLNHQVKDASEKFYGVGPASGIVTSDGTIMFTAYTFTSSDGKTSTFYSKDNGVTWKRGTDLNADDLSKQSSEAALAEGNNGVVYLFNRYGQVCYTSDYGETWTYLDSVGYATGCEVSAMTYSKPIDGKTAILVCGPTNGRYGGKIFVGLINDDNSITWKYNYAVTATGDPFQYSSMTELADGSIGLLYENTVNTTAGVVYKNLPIETILGKDAVIGTPEKTINLTPGETTSFKLNEVVNSGSHTSDVADVTWTKNDTTVTVPAAQLGTNISYSGDTINLNDCLYTFTKNSDGTWLISADANGTTVYVDPYVYNDGGHPNRTYKTNVTLSDGGNNTVNFKDNTADSTGRTGYLHFWDNSSTNLYWDNCTGNSCTGHDLLIYKVADTSSTTVLGGYFEQVTYDELVKGESGAKYLIVGHTISGYDSDGYYAMRPSTSTSDDDKWDHLAKITGGYTDVTTSETTVKIQAKAIGSTSVEIGSTKYNITVQPDSTGAIEHVENVELKVDETKTYTIEGANHVNNITQRPDSAIVDMVVTGTDAVTASKELKEITSTDGLVAGKQYIIVNERREGQNAPNEGLLTTEPYNATVSWSSLVINGLSLEAVASADTEDTWEITPNGDGKYAIKHGLQYLTFDFNTTSTAGLTDTPTYVSFSKTENGNYWYILNAAGVYLSNVGRSDYKGASGFNETGGSGWKIYEIVDPSAPAKTEITFTGVAEGKTTAVVGSTQYNISVGKEENVELTVGEKKTFTDNTGNYENYAGNVQPNASFATMTVTGSDAVSGGNEMVEVTNTDGLAAGKQYIIVSERSTTNGLLTSEVYTATISWSGLGITGLNTNGTVSADTSEIWTITPNANGKYAIKHGDQYLTLDYSSTSTASLTDTETYLNLNKMGNYWYITNDDGDYLSNVGGFVHDYFGASGFNETGGSGWQIFEIVDTSTPASTTITFKGVAEGKTTAVVGNTLYNITVTPASGEPFEKEENVMLLVGQNKTHTDPTGNYEASYTGKGLDENIATVTVKGTTVAGGTTVTPVTTLVSNDTFYIQVSEGVYRTADGGTTTNFAEAELWKAVNTASTYLMLQNTAGKYLNISNNALGLGNYATYYFNFDNGIIHASGITVGTPVKVTATESVDATEITFTGNSEGTTSVIVGKTRYNITVVTTPDCVTSETSPFVVGGNFIGSVTNDAKNEGMDYLTRLTMSSVMTKQNLGGGSGVGYQVDLDSAFANAQSISWSIADESIAKIEVSNGGKTVFVTAADANTTGTTYLSCTIDGQTYTIPVVIIKTTETTAIGSWKYNSLHIAEITRTDAWYSWNCSGNKNQFVKAIEGEAIWTVFDQSEKFCINFYAAPDPDHALTFMSATNSAGEYHTLADKENPKNCDFYTIKGAGYDERTSVGFTDDQVANDIKAALGLGCDGAQGFSRGPGVIAHVNCNLTFISDPVPTIDKTVDGILPTSRKRADYRTYTENMVASVKEQVYFKITVTLAAPSQWMPYDEDTHDYYEEVDGVKYAIDENGNRYSAIVYSDAIVTDTALGTEHAFIYTKEIDLEDDLWDGNIPEKNRRQTDDVTDELNEAWTAEELAAGKREIPLYLVYTIQEEDIPKFEITNVANLNFGFKSHYSTGVTDRAADAEAKITVVGTAMDNVVIDFGQIITYTGLTDTHLKGAFTGEDSKAEAAYGTVHVDYDEATGEFTVTYTPTGILQNPDAVRIWGMGVDENNDPQEKVINGFVVYPATTVYYEEGFMLDGNNGWNDEKASAATVNQTFELLGVSTYDNDGMLTDRTSDKVNAYGYDPIYANGTGASMGSQITSNKVGETTSFTFTGTGFDLYANCTEETGYVSVVVKNAETNKVVKVYTVNTVVGEDYEADGDATDGQAGSMYSLPIVSNQDLEHGTYTVTLQKIKNDDKYVQIDGVRVFNTVDENDYLNEDGTPNSPFAIDLEDAPEFYQLRDYVLDALNVDNTTSADYGTLEEMANQVYQQISTDSEVPTSVILANGKYKGDVQNLLDNGPKNEIYLHEGETLVFNVTTNRMMQIGLKAPIAATNYSITYTLGEDTVNAVTNKSINSSVDMFYELGNSALTDAATYTVTITNEGDDLLSVTDLKICDDPNAAFTALTEKDIETALTIMGYDDPVENPFEDVQEGSFYYEAVLWAAENNIVSGLNDTHFGPDAGCTRAQAVTFLWRAAGRPAPQSTENPFGDVKAGSYYYDAVLWAVENGIVYGESDTRFAPEKTCTRGQIVTFLYRFKNKPQVADGTNIFTDLEEGAYYYDAVLWAVENDITSGIGNNRFAPEKTCTRGQIVTFLYRARS